MVLVAVQHLLRPSPQMLRSKDASRGLTTVLGRCGEWVIEFDRATQKPAKDGSKTGELDAIRAARETLGRAQVYTRNDPPKAKPTEKSDAASNATSPAESSGYSNTTHRPKPPLDTHRSI